MNKRVFVRWCLALTLVWVLVNWNYGLAGIFRRAGFPLVFAWGIGGLQYSDAVALLVDVVAGVVVILGLSWVVAWSHRQPPLPKTSFITPVVEEAARAYFQFSTSKSELVRLAPNEVTEE